MEIKVKVGDIVKTKNKEGKVVLPAVVTKIYNFKNWEGKEKTDVDILFADGTHGNRGNGKYEVTGRHIDMQSVLDSIK